MSSIVLIDESCKNLDKITARHSVGHVIIEDDTVVAFQEWLASEVENDSLRFDMTRKLHFTELSPAQRDKLVEKISKLPMTFKVYITYLDRAMASKTNAKLDLLTQSITHHERNKPNSKYIVEGASEYSGIGKRMKAVDVNSIDFKDYKALLLPDVLLGVLCGFLDIQDPRQSTDVIKWHKLIYNQIRLEVIDYQPKAKSFLVRDKKIV